MLHFASQFYNEDNNIPATLKNQTGNDLATIPRSEITLAAD